MRVIDKIRGGARSAPIDLYEESGVNRTIVPSLNYRSRKLVPLAEQILENPLLMGPAWKIGVRMGALPIKVYAIGNEIKKADNAHPAYQLLRQPAPGAMLTRPLLISGTVVSMLTQRRAAWLKVRDTPTGPPVELWPIPTDALTAKGDARDLISHFEITVPGAAPRRIEKQDVCYFRLLVDPRNWADGASAFQSFGTIGDMGAAAIKRGDEMFETGILSRQWAESVKTLSNRALNRLRRQMETARRDPFGIPLLEDGLKLHDMQGPDASIIVEGIRIAKEIIASTLGIESDQDDKAFYRDAIGPIADAIEQELERSLMPEFDPPAFPEFAFRDLLKGDPKDRIEGHARAIFSGQETPDEARADENRAPLPGGNRLMVPLNMIPIEEAPTGGVPREADTAGGTGGAEGKGTVPDTPTGKQRSGMRAASKRSYQKQRERTIARQSKAASDRLRGIVNRERKAIATLVDGARTAARAEGAAVVLPSMAEIRVVIEQTDGEVGRLLQSFMRQAGDDASTAAADLIGFTEELEIELDAVYRTRAGVVAHRFSGIRADRMSTLLGRATDMRPRDFAEALAETYESLAIHLADGVARTEIAWAHEQAALSTWSFAGVEEMEVVFGGGPCSTGVCEDVAAASPYRLGESLDNVGFSFEGADAPPFHPGCTCFAVAHIEGS